jgi:ribosomal-protein-alanine N-acetyltransferase
VSLREFGPDDLPAWHRIAADPLVAAHTPWPALTTPDAAAAWLNETQRMAALTPRRSFYLGIEQYGTDLVGTGTLDVLSIPHRQGEIGCYLRPDRWGEGLGTEVARLLLELAFTRLGLHRVQATADPENLAAKRVLEHANMRHEGTLLDRYFVDGQWRDRDMYAITLPEWRGQPRRASPVPEPVAEPVAGPVAEPVAGPVVGPVAGAVAQPVAGPVREAATEPVPEPFVEPVPVEPPLEGIVTLASDDLVQPEAPEHSA